MKLLDKLDRKFGKYAIKNLMLVIVGINLAVYLLNMLSVNFSEYSGAGSIVEKLVMHPALVARGEIWRLVTFIFIPESSSMLWILFTLYFYYLVGTSLEQEWGSLKFNAYYLIGMLGTIGASYISYGFVTAYYLNLSLFLAFAYIYPNFQMMLFFMIPIKIKYLGMLSAAFLGYSFITGGWTARCSILAAVANFLLFFGKDILWRLTHRGASYYNKRKFIGKIPKIDTIHRCTVCGMTEKDDIHMEFRYCSKCEGDHEYCMTHLQDHEHIRSGDKT